MYILRLVMLSAILAIVWAGCSDEPDPTAETGDDSQEAKSSPSMLETAEPPLVVSPSAGSGASSAAIDEYAVGCADALSAGLSAIDPESGFTYRQWSNGFAATIKAWEQIDPPEEIADWHNSVLASQKATKELVDGYPGSVDDLILDDEEFLLGMFEELAEYGFAQERAWMNMPSDVRDRLVAAGCYDEGGTGDTVEVDGEKCDRLLDDLTVSGATGTVSPEAARYRCIFSEATTHSGSSTLDNDVLVTVVDQPVGFEFSGEDTPADVKARLYPRLDGNDFVHVSGIQEGDEWHAELDHLESVDLGAVREASHAFTSGLGDYTLVVRASWRGDVEATVFYAIHIRMDLGPVSNLRYAWEGGGSSIRVTWDAVEGADYYNVYLGASGCRDSYLRVCDELASNVVETTYVHVDANAVETYVHVDKVVWRPNYYWVVACSGDWCSEVYSENPAQPIEERPDAPANVRFAIEGASIRVVWEAAEGADSYNVYDDGRLLTTAVVGTDFVHTEPDYGDYEYWVTACNRGGCSDVDFENPAKPFEDRPSVPANARTVVEGSSIRVSWDPVEGAGYYKIYHDDARADSPQGCHLSFAGGVFLCDELAAAVQEASYLHAEPDLGSYNFYWVVACNRGGCSDIDEENPARQMGSESSGPTTKRVDPSPTPESTATITPSDAPETTPTPKPTPTPEVSPEKEPMAPPTPTTTRTAAAIPEETRPSAPSNVRFAIEGASIRVIWDAVEGADHYTVYHGVTPFDSPPLCRQIRDGTVLLCEALATNFEEVAYVHTDPDPRLNDFYWVVACNEGGCSEFDPENPAKPFEERPISPANLRTEVEGSSIRVGWDPVEGAGSYKLYHGESPFDSPLSCRLSLGSVVGFCEELVADVEEASYLHAEPDLGRNNFYWVVACNRGGCSDIDSENPVRQEKSNTQ